MKKIAVFVFLFLILTLAFLGINNQIYVKSVIAYDLRQLEMLSSLYEEFVRESGIDIQNSSVLLDESGFNNFVTNEHYSDSYVRLLRLAEIRKENVENTYYVHVQYDIETYTITLSLKNNNGYNFSEVYSLYVKKDSLLYKKKVT